MTELKKKFKPMCCPVCDGMYFSGPHKDTFDEDIEEYLNGNAQCRHCGWIYDLYQAEHPNSKEGYNEMSVNGLKINLKKIRTMIILTNINLTQFLIFVLSVENMNLKTYYHPIFVLFVVGKILDMKKCLM